MSSKYSQVLQFVFVHLARGRSNYFHICVYINLGLIFARVLRNLRSFGESDVLQFPSSDCVFLRHSESKK